MHATVKIATLRLQEALRCEVEITRQNLSMDGANIQIGRQKWLLGEGRS